MNQSNSTYFSLFFLICFLASFFANTYININTSISATNMQNSKNISFSHQEKNGSSSNDFYIEENEIETENLFQAFVVILPFFITYFLYESSKLKLISAKPSLQKLAKPIYLAVCNFRI